MSWFAERADRILVMFDAHKLDISDEFDHVLGIIRPHSEKVNTNLENTPLAVIKLQ